MTDNYDVYRTSDRQITVETEETTHTFLYNPHTQYALVPATVYAAEPTVMNALRENELITDIFNHDAISTI